MPRKYILLISNILKLRLYWNNHLSCDYLVVDESSMVDIPLFYSLLKALTPHTALLLVGDINQLPLVGAGQALKDIIESKTVSTNEQDQEISIDFYDKVVVFDYTDLDQVTLAYATTIHKSQGSEYQAVIIPITMQSYMMLKRNLIYTAVTRGKKLVVVIEQKKALAVAVKDNKTSRRYTRLKEWLQRGFEFL